MTDQDERVVGRINTLIGSGRSLWFGLMSFLAFISVTLMGIRDADLFLPERLTSLPIISVDIPTLLFFALAPTLAAIFSTYVHVTLARLFTAIGDAPAEIEGQPLSDYVDPWLIADMAMYQRRDGALRNRPLTRTSVFVVLFLTFWLTPLLLLIFYWRSFPAHNEILTLVGCVLPFMVSLFASRESLKHLYDTFTPQQPARFWHRVPGRYLVLTALLFAFGWLRTEGDFRVYADRLDLGAHMAEIVLATGDLSVRFQARDEYLASVYGTASDDPDPDTSFVGINSLIYPTNLSDMDFVEVPSRWVFYGEALESFREEWCRERGFNARFCAEISLDTGMPAKDLSLSWCESNRDRLIADSMVDYDLAAQTTEFEELCDRFVWFLPQQLFTEFWSYRQNARTELRSRDLSKKDLRGARFDFAKLQGANLQESNGSDASFNGADLEGANMVDARFERSDFSFSSLRQALLIGTWLDHAWLRNASLHQANLEGAVLRGADLTSATLGSAYVSNTFMQGALMDGTHFSKTSFFAPASLRGAALRNTDLSVLSYWGPDSIVLTGLAGVLEEAFGDASVILPEGIERPRHWPDEVLDAEAFAQELFAYRESVGLAADTLPGP